jgi:hypothetical protein
MARKKVVHIHRVNLPGQARERAITEDDTRLQRIPLIDVALIRTIDVPLPRAGLTARQFGRLVRRHLLRKNQKMTLAAPPVCLQDRPPSVLAEPAIFGGYSRCERI